MFNNKEPRDCMADEDDTLEDVCKDNGIIPYTIKFNLMVNC